MIDISEISEINPGKGVGKLIFGMKEEEVLSLLGSPTHIHIYDYDTKEEYRILDYDELGLYLTFYKEDNYELSEIELDKNHFTLKGFNLVDEDFDTMVKLLNKLYLEVQVNKENEDISVEEQGLLLSFYESECDYVVLEKI